MAPYAQDIELQCQPQFAHTEASDMHWDLDAPRGTVHSGTLRVPQRLSRAPDSAQPSASNIFDMDPDGTTTTVIGDLPPHMLDRTPIYVSPTETVARSVYPGGVTRASITSPSIGPTLMNSASTSRSSLASFATAPTHTAMMGRTAGRWNNDTCEPQYADLRPPTYPQPRLGRPKRSNLIPLLPRHRRPNHTVAHMAALDNALDRYVRIESGPSTPEDILPHEWPSLARVRALEQEERSSFRRLRRRRTLRAKFGDFVEACKCKILCN